LSGKARGFAETGAKDAAFPETVFISSLEICIFKLEMHVFRLEICISKLEIKIPPRQKRFPERLFSPPKACILIFILIFADDKTKGCPTGRAEIIPYEPDAVSTDEGIVR